MGSKNNYKFIKKIMIIRKIYKSDNIIKVSPEDTLSHAFSLLSSSHDSAFIVEKNNFLGVVNPYYCLIKKSYPFNTKVKNCLVHPPIIDIDYPIKKVAQMMIDSKIHYLPVFEKEKFYAIITARRILSSIKNLEELNVRATDIIKKKRGLVCVYEDDLLSKAINLFKKNRVSKLIVISKDFKLKGILAYFDIISYLIAPQEKTNYGGNEKNKNWMSKKFVKNFIKTQVYTISPEDKISKAADIILDKQIGSVIVVDRDRHPVGIITTKDLLSLYIGKRSFPKIQLVAKNLSKKSVYLVKNFVNIIAGKLSKTRDVVSAKILVKEKKGAGVFSTIFSIFKKNNQVKVIKEEGKNLDKILKEVKNKT